MSGFTVKDAALRTLLDKGIAAARRGLQDRARYYLEAALELDRGNERAWVELAGLAEDPDLARAMCERVLDAHPGSVLAKARLERLRGVPSESARDVDSPPKPEERTLAVDEPTVPEPSCEDPHGPDLFVPPWESKAILPFERRPEPARARRVEWEEGRDASVGK